MVSELFDFSLHFVSLIRVIHQSSHLGLDPRPLVVNASFAQTLELELSFFFRGEKLPLLSILDFADTLLLSFELWSDSDTEVVR